MILNPVEILFAVAGILVLVWAWAMTKAITTCANSNCDLRAKLFELQERHRRLLSFIATAPVSSGVCCCGDPATHDTWDAGHTPVDTWDYAVSQILKDNADFIKEHAPNDPELSRPL